MNSAATPQAGKIARLDAREQLRLSRVLAMLASPHDGERAAAAKLATAFIERHGLTWLDLTSLIGPHAETLPMAVRRTDAGNPPSNPTATIDLYKGRKRPSPGHALDLYW